MNGKGDKDRTSNREAYRIHFDNISWNDDKSAKDEPVKISVADKIKMKIDVIMMMNKQNKGRVSKFKNSHIQALRCEEANRSRFFPVSSNPFALMDFNDGIMDGYGCYDRAQYFKDKME